MWANMELYPIVPKEDFLPTHLTKYPVYVHALFFH